MRILITGASGMLGATLADYFATDHQVFATGNSAFDGQPENYRTFDLAADSYAELIQWSNPDVIIHSAALTNGNYCEENPMNALNVNGLSVRKFLDATNKDVKFVYISTDAVFPSALHLAKETDCVRPENVYGKAKELGEFFLSNSDRKFIIARTTIVGLNRNPKRSGFTEWIINSARNGESIGLFDDVLFTPISIWDLAAELKYLIEQDFTNSEILHISGSEIVTKFSFGAALLESLGLPTDQIKKSSIAAMADRAKRCADQSLDCSHYQKKYGRKLPDLAQTIASIKKHYNEQH